MGVEINGLQTRIDNTPLEDRQRRWMSDSQNSLREFYKTDVILMSASLSNNLKELKEELIEEVHEMLNIFESMEQKVNGKSSKENILQNEIDRLLEVSLTSEIQNCVLISIEKQRNELLKAELEKSLSGSKDIQANLLKRIKILENDFKRSQAQGIDFKLKLQHQKEKMDCDVSWKSKLSIINDENVLLKTQVDSVVKERENIKLEYQKLFNSIKATQTQHQKELDEMIEHVNQKTYAYADVRAQNQDLLTLRTLLCVTPLPKNIAVKAKKVSTTKVNTDRSKPITSYLTPKNEQSVESSNSVRRQKSKATKSKDRVLKSKTDKRSSAHVLKMSSSVSIDSNNRETMHSNVCQSNTSVLSTKTVNDAKITTVRNKVSSVLPLSSDSSQRRILSNYMKNKIATSRKWQKWFENQQHFNWTPKSKIAQSLPSEIKSRICVRSTSNTLVTTQKWVAKLSTLPSAFISCDAGDPARPLDC
ncbi:hypothetical protein Tco_0662340 [Tanacetum coccineum]